ncbi:MAG: metal ABC transporter substrate-binding protein [Burkholderiaceae bacterium]|jgi:zinc/manganese transport system substrate-binding protein|nr:metal ABC transporter substrate-binding protein [Burkholderiaceae bacterium]MDP4968799.1 metal ABC transporter substrate-binding protein [Burkholderiaceae bacterium]
MLKTFLNKVRLLTTMVLLGAAVPVMANEPLPVVASFSILADMVKQVGGPHVQVSSLVGPNSDAHVFDPTPADAKRLAAAKLVVVNGLGFEGWLNRLVKSSGYKGPVLTASKGVKTIPMAESDHGHGHSHSHAAPDPHAWQSLLNARQYVENIRVALSAAMPAHSADFQSRATDYLKQIDALEKSTQARIAAVPMERRRVITSHDAFGYFARAYKFTFYPLQGLSTASEPSAADVVRIVNEIKKNKVTAIFAENISDPRVLERVAKDTGAKIGGTLYADALSAPGTQADTYLKMFELNVSTIVSGISAPAKP